jgi:hypothetical protein
MKLAYLIVSTAALTAMVTLAASAQESPFWNLPVPAKGQAWCLQYTGSVSWYEDGETQKRAVTWQVLVLEGVRRGNIRAWRLLGHPVELAAYQSALKPGYHTIVEVDGRNYYHCPPERYARVLDLNDDLKEIAGESELVLECPLALGATFGEWDSVVMPEGGDAEKARCYSVVYRALNSVITCEWQEGAGLIRYTYHHNGTPADCDVRLTSQHFIEYRSEK